MRNDSAEILSVLVPILIKTGFSFLKSVEICFAGTDYKSAQSGSKILICFYCNTNVTILRYIFF